MRTTIRINDHLLNEAKKLALENNTSLSALVETAIKDMLGRRQKYRLNIPVQLPTFKGKGLKHGVDLDDTAALLELMEAK
uniref:Type II toxin-antitoxin system VapB family antitoxin n=1 Tax=Candidatus Desulfatibia profunda TaxID=2841695 RepID=A0A8J6NXL3_9BACT|nr:type II toxin-antitoxin system VapB family antitoxin [Candidatus Desulfatibia profunda]